MSQRVSGYERAEDDFYPTPEWVTDTLLPHIPARVRAIWEPAAGDGVMAGVFERAGYRVFASDIKGHGAGGECGVIAGPRWNFMAARHRFFEFDAVITNPPYEQAPQFIQRALELTREPAGVVAMLLRVDFDSAARKVPLFKLSRAFSKKLVLTRRIQWFADGGGSPSFNHAWFIWDWAHDGPPVIAYGPEPAEPALGL